MNSLTVSGTVAANCRAEAARHGKSTLDVSAGTGIHRVTIGRRFSGQSAFTVDEVAAVAQYLEIPIATLFVGVDELLTGKKASA